MIINPKQVVDETIDMYSPVQVYEELVMLTTFLASRTLINVLEIGSHRCGILNILANMATGKIISVDDYDPSAEDYRKKFLKSCPRAKLLKGNSHDMLVKESVEQVLNGEALDLLLIDGDHSTAGIYQDFRMYSPLVAQGGIIALHDIDPQHAVLTEPANVWRNLKVDPRFASDSIIHVGTTPDVDYSNRKSLIRIADLLFRRPKLFHKRFPTLKGLPCRLGGFGILCKL